MKVQAQRKFAQNSGVHSPIITPIRDLETADLPHTSVMPEPVELLPMKRPNTEDFLTFLCFRGTPILPPNLQFFNTASIVTDGQVHEIKGDSPKNGPIDITKCAGSSSEKPFIAFGVRKRADPIVISRQMERKRRHALALQVLYFSLIIRVPTYLRECSPTCALGNCHSNTLARVFERARTKVQTLLIIYRQVL